MKNYFLFLLTGVIMFTLVFCANQQKQLKVEVTERIKQVEELNCSTLLEEAKDLLLKGKDHIFASEQHQLEDAHFNFSENCQCISEDKVIFGMIVDIRYFDISVNEFICGTLTMDVIVERTADEIEFEFGDLVVKSLEICESSLKVEVFSQ